MDLDVAVHRLRLLKSNHLSQRYSLEDQIARRLPEKIAYYQQCIEGYAADMDRLKENTHPNEDGFSPMEVEGTVYTDKRAAGSAILAVCKAMKSGDPVHLGQYRGFDMEGRIKEMEQPKPLHRGRPPIEIAKEQPFDCSFT